MINLNPEINIPGKAGKAVEAFFDYFPIVRDKLDWNSKSVCSLWHRASRPVVVSAILTGLVAPQISPNPEYRTLTRDGTTSFAQEFIEEANDHRNREYLVKKFGKLLDVDNLEMEKTKEIIPGKDYQEVLKESPGKYENGETQ